MPLHALADLSNCSSPTLPSGFQIAESGGGIDTFGMRSSAADTWSMYGPSYGDVMTFLKDGTVNMTPLALTISGGPLTVNTGTITTSQPLALTQTWNNAAVTFTGLQVNVTDTASNAASLLMDLQADGLSKFRVKTQPAAGPNSDGFLWEANTSGGVFSINGSGNTVNLGQSGNHDIALANGQVSVFRSGGIRIGTSTALSPRLYADADSTLAQRNGDGANAAQTFRLYNTYTGSTSFERLNFRWDNSSGTPIAKIGTEKGSAGGAARDLVLETNGTERVRVGATSGTVSIAAAGSATTPSLNFGDATTGIYKQSTDRIGFTAGGGLKVVIYSSGMYMQTGSAFGINTANFFRIGSGGVELATTPAGGTLAPLTVSNLTASGTIEASQPIIFPSYTVGTAPTGATYIGGMVYITDEVDGPTMAFYDGTNWRRVQDRAIISVAP